MAPLLSALKASDWLSIAAITVSMLSLAVSFFTAYRDRPIIRGEASAWRHDETGEYYRIGVKVVNIGNRPVILRHLWGRYSDGTRKGMVLEADRGRLEPYELYEYVFGKYDGMMMRFDEDGNEGVLTDLFVGDTAGRIYKIKGAKLAASRVRSSKHPITIS